MATPTTYTFTITPFNSDQFTTQILQSTISTALDHISTDGSTVNILFKDVLSSGDETTLDGLVSAYVYVAPVAPTGPISVQPIGPVNTVNAPITEVMLSRGQTGFTNFTIVTHDFSDRTTWYQKSIAITGETLLDSGDGLTFTSANAHWVNIRSPKLTLDYKKVLERDGSLTTPSLRYTVVKSNGTTLVEGAGSDYTVNYTTGVVTFNSTQSGNTITANYYHNNGVTHCSEFLYVPPTNTQYQIEHIESQFSINTAFNDVINAEVWAGGVTYSSGNYSVNLSAYGNFADAYYDAGYGQTRTYYRNMNDLFNWCDNAYPPTPPCGALLNTVLNFCFFYAVHPVLTVKQGAVIRMYLANDTPLTAEICSLTIYMAKGPA